MASTSKCNKTLGDLVAKPQVLGCSPCAAARVRSTQRWPILAILSARAGKILADWDAMIAKFVKVMPKDFKRVQESMKRVQQSGLSG